MRDTLLQLPWIICGLIIYRLLKRLYQSRFGCGGTQGHNWKPLDCEPHDVGLSGPGWTANSRRCQRCGYVEVYARKDHTAEPERDGQSDLGGGAA